MRIPAGLNSSRYAFIRDKVKIDDTNKTDSKSLRSPLSNLVGFPTNIDILQKTNKVIFKLAQNATSIILTLEEGFLPKNESAVQVKLTDNISLMGYDLEEIVDTCKDVLQLSNEGLEELVVTLVRAMNEVLRLANNEIDSGVSSSRGLTTDGDGLQILKKIILSAFNTPDTISDGSLNSSLLRVKLMPNGLFSIDHQSLKEALLLNNNDVARTVKVVAQTLCDTLPLCIDPNSGMLVYTGKSIEEDGNKNASNELNAIDEELEKERAELDSRLRVIDGLISYSNKLIDDLIHQPEMISCEG